MTFTLAKHKFKSNVIAIEPSFTRTQLGFENNSLFYNQIKCMFAIKQYILCKIFFVLT